MKKIFLEIYVCLMIILITGFQSYAQDGGFSAVANPSQVGVTEQLELTFTLNTNGDHFTPPSLKDFFILSGPNQSTSMQFINGSMSQSISFSFILQPKSPGTFKIGGASIEVSGKIVKANPVTVTVNKSSNNAAGGGSGGGNGGGEPSVDTQLANNIFIKAIVNKTSVLRGEPVKVTYKLFSKVDLVDLSVSKLPTLNGFWSQDESKLKRLEIKKEVINGTQYLTTEIKKTVLFAQRDGVLELDPMEAQSVVRIKTRRPSRSRDPFDDFFNDPFFGGNYQDMKYVVKSEPVKIKVAPLPDHAPTGFSGAVGTFSMESFIDKPVTKANEPVTLKIKISGEGNIKLIDPITLTLPPDIETYDPKISENTAPSPGGITGNKTFEYLLIPRHEGEYKIKPLEFSYYSLLKKKYITLSSPEFSLKVNKGDATITTITNEVEKEDVQLLGKDIRFIKTNAVDFKTKGDYFFKSKTFYFLMASPVFLLSLAFLVLKKQEKDLKDSGYKTRRSTKIARKRLAQAKTFLDKGDKGKVYDEILKSFWSYLSEKYQIPAGELSKNKVEQVLKTKGKEAYIIQDVVGVIDQCEFARYAPASSMNEVGQVYSRAIGVIEKLEES